MTFSKINLVNILRKKNLLDNPFRDFKTSRQINAKTEKSGSHM